MSCEAKIRRTLGLSLVMVALSVCLAHASATLLLEEPYGKLGFFTATGHAAVYLSGVCAETPLKLRPCRSGELGAVISRYDGVGGYDWVAIPLIPYLYAVERTEDIPLFVDPKVVTFLRDQYRRKHLEGVAPDVKNGETPGGNWYELAGSAYDRAEYAFEIQTSSEQDQAFIRAYNLSSNESHFHTVSRNCADFAKDVINFYYPKALHRSVVADVGITTPKQMAKTMVKYSTRHPQLEFTRYVIPQVPGSEARSTPVHGVVESFFKSKKYIVPSAVVSPVFAGSVAAVYVGTVAGRFDPARNSLVYNADRGLEPPIGAEDRRSYELELNHLLAEDPSEPGRVEKNLARTMNSAAPGFDSEGHPVLMVNMADAALTVGMVPGNIFASKSSQRFAQQILEARLRQELRRGNAPKVSELDVEHDWALLQETLHVSSDEEVATQSVKPVTASWPLRWIRAGNKP
jgi:hypothetical protein